ncbi:hypothetical protein BU15DRAFT_76581 [Melanogaster broomeanus]|nr:hypothetical protein BU15DRAFT_76581 [Melanogaster broomeanus]
MPLLGGIFNKRDKQSSSSRHISSNVPTTATESVASSASTKQSTDVDIPSKSLLPPGGLYALPAASSSKLRLPFRRKQAHPTGSGDTSQLVISLNDAPVPSYISGAVSDSGHLPQPPPKSSIFGVYNDRNVHSTHSLPHETPSQQLHLDTPSRSSYHDVRSETRSTSSMSPPAPPPKKPGGLLSWARARTKSKPSQPSSSVLSTPYPSPSADDPSFNLKAFRHVRSDSPAPSPEKSDPVSSDLPLPVPRPRPRGDSVASDSSQRISVAAFREAQARRSRAGSPAPSFRPPSAADTLRVDGSGRQRASTVSAVSATEHIQPIRSSAAPMSDSRPTSSALQTSSSDDSDSEDDEDEEEEVDSDAEPIQQKPIRKRTITRRVGDPRARSDVGHSSGHEASLPRPEFPRWPKSGATQVTQRNPPLSTRTMALASASTSALIPNTAARGVPVPGVTHSVVALPGQSKAPAQKPRNRDDSDTSSDSSNSDSEDMPLSSLVAPRRPGSSASVATDQSGGRPWVPAKPLIDIKSLVGEAPLLTPILRHENSIRNLSGKGKEREANAASSSPVSKQSTATGDKQTLASHNRRSGSDAPTPPKFTRTDVDDDLLNAIRLVSSLDKVAEKSRSPTSATAHPVASLALEASSSQPTPASDRIVPTAIRQRTAPTSFTVLSRPPQHRNSADISTSPSSPTSQTSLSPAASKSAMPTRQRASTMVNSPLHNDRSDAISVVSTSRSSASRSSSAVPLVPLIHSIPDSPSVKEDYRPGRPPRSRLMTPSSSDPRSRPPSSTLAPSGISSPARSQLSLMPQRPFASTSSIRGESPAGSSTGDSSSGRGAPFTPRDGSDIGIRSRDDGSDVGSTLKARHHMKKPSVTFEDTLPPGGREKAKTEMTSEERTRQRRRSEALASHELGKLVNGRGPLHGDSDEDMGLPSNPRITVAPMMGMGTGMPGATPGWVPWQQSMPTGMAPLVPPQYGTDPAFLVAHQRALMIAKQTYQMAVAQHAIQAAGEEWERSSNAGFGSGGSAYGGGHGGSVYGGGSGGSVYGGVGGAGGGMGPGMMGIPGMLMPPNQWSRGSVMFPSATASVYGGISSSQSEFGGGGGWGTRSVYGETFGPSSSRSNHRAPAVPNSSASAYGGSRPRARTGVPPSPGPAGLQTKSAGKSPIRNKVAPPSSWKNIQ